MTSESKNDTFSETVEFEKVCLDQINRTISARTHACLQLESYNQLFQEIPEIFHMYSLSTISAPDPHKVTAGNAVEDTRPFSLRFGNVYYDPPTKTTQNQRTGKLYPFEARIRGMTYAVRVSVDITLHDHNTGETVTHTRMPFFDIPCMVRSEWCHLHNATKQQIIDAKECLAEPGGYFIIDGGEKCVINQMRMAYNNMMPVKSSKRGGIVVDYRTYSEETGKTSQVQAFIDGGNVRFDLTFITSPISLTVLLLALDLDDVIQTLSEAGLMDSPYNLYTSSAVADFIQMSADSEQYTPQEAACLWIGSNARQQQPSDEAAIEYTRSKILRTSMFIHLGASAPHTERVNIILRLVRTVIRANLPKSHELYIPPTDKDNLVNKRVETTGVLLREIIRMHMSSLVKSVIPKDFAKSSFNSGTVVDYLRKQGEKITVDINKRFKETTPWDNPARGGTNNFSRTGVSQALSRMNMPAMCSQLLRINQPISKSAKVKEPRHVNSTHIGFIDPFDTPESGSAGLVLQLCSMIKISQNHPTVIIADNISDILQGYPQGDASVMVNGIVLPGGVEDPVAVVEDFRNRRVQGDIPFDVSVSYDLVENAVAIRSEDGRMMRMLWYVGDQDINEFMAEIRESISQGGSLQTLQDAGLVRWIDSVEITDLTVAMEPCDFSRGEFKYMEIHPSVIVGMCTQNSPYSEHMPSPRCCYQCSHYKQALGVATTVDTFRTDTTSHRMWYPSTRLVQTRQSQLIQLPTGQMCTVAICTMNGAGQEDAIVMNRASVNRGLFRVTTRKTHTIQEDPMQHISFPTEYLRETMERTRGYDYSKLGPDGIVRVGEYVSENDVIVARYTSNTERKASGAIEETRRDSSLVVARDKEGFVDTVHVARNGDGYLVVHVIIRKSRIPEPGDKWATSNAQKGTVAYLEAPENLPFDPLTGQTPDIIFNPHGLPSRMTLGYIYELIQGRISVITGDTADATIFSESSRPKNGETIGHVLERKLKELGMNCTGTRDMYDGRTGQPIQAQILMGPMFYQRLKHMVSDKVHARAKGDVHMVFGQPVGGRERGGGLRVGEMESSALIGIGASHFLHDRMFKASDAAVEDFCDDCGAFAQNPKQCVNCGGISISQANLPVAGRLMFQQVNAMGIDTTYETAYR